MLAQVLFSGLALGSIYGLVALGFAVVFKATEVFKAAQRVIDSVADKGVFHKNKAARLKSRLSAKVKALALAA